MRLAARHAGALLLALALPAGAHRDAEPPAVLDFTPPPAGTYELPVIQPAPEGEVLDTAGHARAFGDYTRGRFTLLGLVYTRCGDPEGCPRATWAFNAVRRLLRADPALQRRVRLVTLSFDPAHDDPKAMGAYARRVHATGAGADWHFLTTVSRPSLDPILDGLGQDLRVAADSKALPGTEEFTHSLKVFLIDPDARVREIYSTGYLMPQMIVNDLRTLAGEVTRSR
jgi:protein SCO1/2